MSMGHLPQRSSRSAPVESVVVMQVRSNESMAMISMSPTLMTSPGLTTRQRSSGTPHLSQKSTDFCGPMNGTGMVFPDSSVVVMPDWITCAANSLDMWS